jgi:hypothetical protein
MYSRGDSLPRSDVAVLVEFGRIERKLVQMLAAAYRINLHDARSQFGTLLTNATRPCRAVALMTTSHIPERAEGSQIGRVWHFAFETVRWIAPSFGEKEVVLVVKRTPNAIIFMYHLQIYTFFD